jgi:hypothetical protein
MAKCRIRFMRIRYRITSLLLKRGQGPQLRPCPAAKPLHSAFIIFLQKERPLKETGFSSLLAGALQSDRFNVMNRNQHSFYGRQSLLFKALAENSQHISRNHPTCKLPDPKLTL